MVVVVVGNVKNLALEGVGILGRAGGGEGED